MKFEERLLVAYDYAMKNAYKYEKVKYYRGDLVNDTMLKIMSFPEALMKLEGSINSWVNTVMRNVKINSIRYEKRRPTVDDFKRGVSEDGEELTFTDSHLGNQILDPDSSIDAEKVMSFIYSNKFSRHAGKYECRDVYVKYLDGYKPREIAEETGKTVNTVSRHLSKAKCKVFTHFPELKNLYN